MNQHDSIIFLDVDGVLNDMAHDNLTEDWDAPSDCHLSILKDIVIASNAGLVLTSSWRVSEDAMKILNRRLADWDMALYDQLPILDFERAAEIRAWLAQHPEVKHFVILDDDVDNYTGELAYKFVRTYPMSGLLPRHAILAKLILEN